MTPSYDPLQELHRHLPALVVPDEPRDRGGGCVAVGRVSILEVGVDPFPQAWHVGGRRLLGDGGIRVPSCLFPSNMQYSSLCRK